MAGFSPDDQNEVFRVATQFINETSEHIFLTGKAGTGKTTFLKYICEHTHKRVLVATPTGVAAINAGGVTLHSLFQLPLEPYIPGTKLKDTFRFGKAKIDLLRQMELLIIDEVSMLRVDMLDAIDNTLRFVRRTALPFGGVQVLYIGDMFQLPPVVKDEEWAILGQYYSGPFFFYAKVLEQRKPVYLELKKVYRQQDEVFVDLLNRVRNNIVTTADLQLLNQQYVPGHKAGEKEIVLTTHNYQADLINEEMMQLLPGKKHAYQGEIRGEFPENTLPTEKVLQLKVGAQVMFIKNDLQEPKRYYNGKLGQVTRLTNDAIYVLPEATNDEIKVERETWSNVRYVLNKERGEIEEEEQGSFVQYPLRTAWAITIHKSQGLTFDKVVIDIARAFAAGQAYVALSRCRSLAGITLQSPVKAGVIQTDGHAIAFARQERPVQELLPVLDAAKHEFWQRRLQEYYDWAPLLRLLYELKQLAESKTSEDFVSVVGLANTLMAKAREQQDVAKRFHAQLGKLAAHSLDTALPLLQERCTKASLFFYEDIRLHILQPLQNHRAGFKQLKRARTYAKELQRIEENIILFTSNLLRVRYYNQPLVVVEQELPRLQSASELAIDAPKPEAKARASAKAVSGVPKEKKEKGATMRQSLDMFVGGKTIDEIATERQLTRSTIVSHLARFIHTGQVAMADLVQPQRADKMLAVLDQHKPNVEQGVVPFELLKQHMGADFDYSDARVVSQYWQQRQEALSQTPQEGAG